MIFYCEHNGRRIMYDDKTNRFHAYADKDLSAETAAELMTLIDEEIKNDSERH